VQTYVDPIDECEDDDKKCDVYGEFVLEMSLCDKYMHDTRKIKELKKAIKDIVDRICIYIDVNERTTELSYFALKNDLFYDAEYIYIKDIQINSYYKDEIIMIIVSYYPSPI
jgi:hypothetical protein